MPRNVEEVKNLLAETMAGMHARRLDPRIGSVLGYLGTALLKAMEATDLEKRSRHWSNMDFRSRVTRLEQEQGCLRVPEPILVAGMGTAVFDPLVWLQQYTCSKDSHWKEAGAGTPYRPFPDKPYFRFVLDEIHRNKVLLIEKSRDMMLSWLCVGYFTHAAITTERREVLFQSQKEDKAAELIDYAWMRLHSSRKPARLYDAAVPGVREDRGREFRGSRMVC